MIDVRLDQMLSMLELGAVIGPVAFENVDLVLARNCRQSHADIRDKSDYQINIATVRNELDQRWRLQPVHPDLRELHELICETACKICLLNIPDIEDCQTELSYCIQEEFDLMAKARALDWENEWLDGIWAVYKQNRIPMPPWVVIPIVFRTSAMVACLGKHR